jgi:glutamate racemase
LQEVIANICGSSVTLVSAGEESAYELKRLLKARNLRGDLSHAGEAQFFVSDQTEDFENMASLFLREDLRHTVRRIDIEQY